MFNLCSFFCKSIEKLHSTRILCERLVAKDVISCLPTFLLPNLVCRLMGFLVILIPVFFISVLVACYSKASIVNREMLEITTLQRFSKYKMYSPIFLAI
jgi:hypothetical protein